MYIPLYSRRHVFYLWHQWRWEHQLYFNCNGSTVLCNIGDTDQLKQDGQGSGDWGAGTMEEDGISLPDSRDSKRLKRGFRLSNPPSLSSECTFLSTILDRQCNPEQRHFGLAYKKWLESVIGKELWEEKKKIAEHIILKSTIKFSYDKIVLVWCCAAIRNQLTHFLSDCCFLCVRACMRMGDIIPYLINFKHLSVYRF